ncbi:MAG: TolB family protein [Chitinophagales bacterium]
MRNLIAIALFLPSCYTFSQVPGYEIYYMYIGGNEDTGYVYSEPMNITNRAGYDNQPSFTKEGSKILYSSIRDEKQADIYMYDLKTNTTKQFCKTPESEYSPEVTPGGKYISVVRVEKDSSQRLWKMKMKNAKAKVMLQFVYDVGYYCRVSDDNIALFQLPEPFALKLASLNWQDAKPIDDNIGRCIKMIPGENAFTYLVKDDSTAFQINRYDVITSTSSKIISIGNSTEDFAWRSDGNMFMANGSTLYYFDYKETGKWYVLDDMQKFGISKILRIAFSPDGNWMSFVADETIQK